MERRDPNDSRAYKVIPLVDFSDSRGRLFEIFHVSADTEMAYVVDTLPGQARSEDTWHVHKHKTERMICLSGKIDLALKRGDEEPMVFCLSEDRLEFVVVDRLCLHSIKNNYVEKAIVFVLCDSAYDPQDELRVPMEDWNWDQCRPKNKTE